MITREDAVQAIERAMEGDFAFMIDDPSIRVQTMDAGPGRPGSRVTSGLMETVRALGDAGLIVRVHMQTWNAALAPRITHVDVVLDLEEEMEVVVAAARKQMDLHVDWQRRLNSLAITVGFTGFPSLRQYADPDWLKVDRAVWEALTHSVGARETGRWVRDALARIYEREADLRRGVHCPADVFYGQFRPYLLVDPFLLGTPERKTRPSSWLGTRIVLPRPWIGTVPQIGDLVAQHVQDLPGCVGGRRIVKTTGPGNDDLGGVLPFRLPPSFDYESDLMPLGSLA